MKSDIKTNKKTKSNININPLKKNINKQKFDSK